jgi:hypothetical protein
MASAAKPSNFAAIVASPKIERASGDMDCYASLAMTVAQLDRQPP